MNLAKALVAAFALATVALAKHAYKKLNAKELAEAKDIAVKLLGYDGKTNTQTKQLAKGEQPWASKVEMTDLRFDGIGNLFVVEIKDGTPIFPWIVNKLSGKVPDPNKPDENVTPGTPKHCTAFKIGTDLLATAGHCLRDAGVTETSQHALIFRRHYDATQAYNADIAKTRTKHAKN